MAEVIPCDLRGEVIKDQIPLDDLFRGRHIVVGPYDLATCCCHS